MSPDAWIAVLGIVFLICMTVIVVAACLTDRGYRPPEYRRPARTEQPLWKSENFK